MRRPYQCNGNTNMANHENPKYYINKILRNDPQLCTSSTNKRNKPNECSVSEDVKSTEKRFRDDLVIQLKLLCMLVVA